jgi:dGTPase
MFAPELKPPSAGCKPTRMNLAPYAVQPARSRGRLYPEPEARTRSPYQRDRDRIIHSSAFRKLQYKTQVFVNHEGDFYRTRLTHSIEVAQIARSVARELGLDEDLTEALALAHDLGHPPFGHAGEEALNLAMKPFGGFDHNAQSLRVVTLLESRYAGWDGLNLTWETLEGLAKHNGPLRNPPAYIAEYNDRHKLDLTTHASAEAQVAAIADDIAYHSHDLDDGLRARLFGPEDVAHLPVVHEALAEARISSLDVPPPRLRHETIRRVINAMITDLIEETRRRLAKLDPKDADAVRRAKQRVVAFAPAMAEAHMVIKDFLFARMYRHWRVNRMTTKARRLTEELFRLLHADPTLLPDDWRARAGEGSTQRAATVVADYVAGMTDRYAMDEHRRLTDVGVSG